MNSARKQVRVIDFNGNFGQHMAIMAAFERVRGEVIVTLDADLQNPPEEIPKLLAAIEAGHDVVGGYRKNRQDTFFRKYASRIINGIRAKITNIRMKDQGCMLRAYRRNIVESIVASDETSTFIPALAYSYAANPAEVEVEHAARAAGESKYRLYDLIRLNFDLMTGFSVVPLQVFTLFGMVVSVLSLLFVDLPLYPAPDRRSRGRGRVHPLRDPLFPRRHRHHGTRHHRRIHRPHLQGSEAQTAVRDPRRSTRRSMNKPAYLFLRTTTSAMNAWMP